ncbi:hypothetical protein [uncultured Endozoicomonas sp.]|uniref:hypothetical protein n=1 Tax=uncultured Endozoicomonas sp. TaxID=432652 RepID=UPI00261864E8|nr:hypothetical protein [uncultured Endozoicomonas sp.]
MNKQFIAATVLTLSAMTGMAQADLATDLTRMPAAEALAKATQSQSMSIEALISDAALQLEQSPQLLNALISAAVAAYPEQAVQIVTAAVSAAPAQKASITKAATAQLADNPAAQQAVVSAANTAANKAEQQKLANNQKDKQKNLEAEQTQAPAANIPPPPQVNTGGSNDKPTSVSPTN